LLRTDLCVVKNFFKFFSKTSGDNSERSRNYGIPICNAITLFNIGDYHQVVQTLFPIRHKLYHLGGSNAQRDIFTQMLIHSALSSEDVNDHKIAKALLEERSVTKKNSFLGERLFKKYQQL
uniref:ERAP1_C domain-containing protein n=1 Tax=Thelazia callipaeda TaxID=103827 RepID=A0A0N5CS28_THECL